MVFQKPTSVQYITFTCIKFCGIISLTPTMMATLTKLLEVPFLFKNQYILSVPSKSGIKQQIFFNKLLNF